MILWELKQIRNNNTIIVLIYTHKICLFLEDIIDTLYLSLDFRVLNNLSL